MKSVVLVISLALACSASWAQGSKEQPLETKLEALSSKAGVILVEGFETIGKLDAQAGDGNSPAVVSVQVTELMKAGTTTKLQGIKLSVTEGSKMATVSIDYDEIEGLLGAIDYFQKMTGKETKLSGWEGRILTKGGLRMIYFGSKKGVFFLALELGTTAVIIRGPQVGGLRELIAKAKSKLDEQP